MMFTNLKVLLPIAVGLAITIALKITGNIDLNKIYKKLCNIYNTRKYNKKANDYIRLFDYFHQNMILSPYSKIASFLMNSCNTLVYYPDDKKKKIFVLKNDKKRKNKANNYYLTEIESCELGNGYIPFIEENDKFCKSDFYCHKELSRNYKYYLELNELFEKDYNFQTIIQAKWQNESNAYLGIIEMNKK